MRAFVVAVGSEGGAPVNELRFAKLETLR